MTWFTTVTATATNNSANVNVGSTSVVGVKAGDALIIGSFSAVEILATSTSGADNIIVLVSVWGDATQTSVAAHVLPTGGQFRDATDSLVTATTITADNFKSMDTWGTGDGTPLTEQELIDDPTAPAGYVYFKGQDGETYKALTMAAADTLFDDTLATKVSEWDTAKTDVDTTLATLVGKEGYNEFDGERARNNGKYAASGFVHMGDGSLTSARINTNVGLVTAAEGFESTAWANLMSLGYSGAENISKTIFPVINIAGMTTDLETNSYSPGSGNLINKIKFPAAPDGTVTYDSADGTITQHASAAEAFEGLVTNGDFRDGTVGFTGGNGASLGVTAGVLRMTQDTDGNGQLTYTSESPYVDGETYRIEIYVVATTYAAPHFYHQGATTTLVVGLNVIEFTYTTGDLIFVVRAASGLATQYVDVASISVMPVTEEVVTQRVDMWGFEGYLEEVTVGNPFVYPNGLIQSQATTMEGITTVSSARPDTYYAVFDGDTTSKGLGVDWFAASVTEQELMFANKKNKLYLIGGLIYQWRVRQRTIAGAGNGDWKTISTLTSGTSPNSALNYDGTRNDATFLRPQGMLDSIPFVLGVGAGATNPYYASNLSDVFQSSALGVFHAVGTDAGLSPTNKVGAFGHCYFLVCGTVPRFNQGAFHPGFNAFGAGKFYNINGLASARGWDDSESKKPISAMQCFDANATNQVGNVSPYTNLTYGTIAGDQSGRPDERFYDAIYAGGLGGVIDLRLPAWDKGSPQDAAMVDALVKAGVYRGVEKLKFTKVLDGALDGGVYKYRYIANKWTIYGAIVADVSVGDTLYLHDATVGGTIYGVVDAVAGDYCQLTEPPNTVGNALPTSVLIGDPNVVSVVHTVDTNISVSGDFLQTDVIGDPVNILGNPDLQNGWMGAWVDTIPDGSGTTNPIPFTRKAVVTTGLDLIADTAGNGTYSVYAGIVVTDNGFPMAATNTPQVVGVVNYLAFAKQTEPCVSKKVYGGEAGMGSVFASNTYLPDYGALLGESLLGKVLVTSTDYQTLALNQLGISPDTGFLYTGTSETKLCKHTPLSLLQGDVAFKALNYQIESNQQVSIAYAFEEMIWDTNKDHGSEFTDIPASTLANAVVVGTYYDITDGPYSGLYICRSASVTASPFDSIVNMYLDSNNNIMALNGTVLMERWDGTGWGNADTPLSINDNTITGTDDNGQTIIVGTAELALPRGWRKNNV